MKPKKELNIFIIMFIIIGAIILFEQFGYSCEENFDQAIKENYYGLVIEKYIDRKSHNYKTVTLKRRDVIYSIYFNFDISGLSAQTLLPVPNRKQVFASLIQTII